MKGGFNNPPNPLSHPINRDTQGASMKGGFNNPPNLYVAVGGGEHLHVASMKGGFNNPPNPTPNLRTCCKIVASMKGGFNNPPNQHRDVIESDPILLQ